MNKFLINITKSLNIKEDQWSPPVCIKDIHKKHFFYPSIDKNRKTYKSNKKFFQSSAQVILSIDGSKALREIPVDMIKFIWGIYLSLIIKIINFFFENGCFPDDLKDAEISPIFKKDSNLHKENYRPASVLFTVSQNHVPTNLCVHARLTVKPINRFYKKP